MTTVPVTDITARYHGGDEMSAAAFEQTPAQSRLLDRNRIATSLRHDGPATCQQLEDRIGLSHESCSARISEMRKDGTVVTVGEAVNRSGRKARVHALAELVNAGADQG
jgi:hypothetical protein